MWNTFKNITHSHLSFNAKYFCKYLNTVPSIPEEENLVRSISSLLSFLDANVVTIFFSYWWLWRSTGHSSPGNFAQCFILKETGHIPGLHDSCHDIPHTWFISSKTPFNTSPQHRQSCKFEAPVPRKQWVLKKFHNELIDFLSCDLLSKTNPL